MNDCEKLYEVYLELYRLFPKETLRLAFEVLKEISNDERYLEEKRKSEFIVLDCNNLRRFFDKIFEEEE